MAKYIDAEHLIQKINDNRELSRWAKNVAISCVMDTPVVNAVEVVRCKECKHFKEPELCTRFGDLIRWNDFCWMGEKRWR